MRILFLFLLLLNLGYFGWHWQQQDAAPMQTGTALPAAPGAKTLVLLNEAGAAAGSAGVTPRSDTLQETPSAGP